MVELGKHTVDFSALIGRVADESFLSLKELVENAKSPELYDTDKKVSLLKYIVKTQQRLLRLNALAKWCKQVPLINSCQDLGSTLSSHYICFTQAADSLFFMHEGLQQARAPVYDVPSAVEILLTGSYQRLPKCVDDMGMQCSLDGHQQKPVLRKLEILFNVLVTLGYRGHLSMWRILHLDLLVGERSGPIKLEVMRRHILGDDLERRMSVAESPFTILYAVLHELCLAVVMDTVIRQVQALLHGRWKDALRFDLISDTGTTTPANQEGEADSVSLRTPGVKLMCWSDSDKNSGPFIKIEPGSDLQIKCSHSTFVIDPLTGKEAEFSLDQSCVDVEKLLLKAIWCNRYTRLLEIQKELLRNARICRALSDVFLQAFLDEPGIEGENLVDSKEQVEPEMLRVRAYGSSFLSLGINIRTGRFFLQSSKSILTPFILTEFEDVLNQGSICAVDAFINLRSKSILHFFAAIGKFLGLEVVYKHGFGINKVPKNLLEGSNFLALGFPDCESSHLLLIELEKDFTPLFKLVETQTDGSGKPQLFNDLSNVLRVNKIDIGQRRILEDDLNLITSDVDSFVSSFSDAKSLNQASGHRHPGLVEESLADMSGNQLSFSSIVDEVFGHQKETSDLVLSDNLPAVDDRGKVPFMTSYRSDSIYSRQGSLTAGKGVSEAGSRMVTESSLSPLPKSRKRSASDLLRLIPSLQGVEGVDNPNKRGKTSELVQSHASQTLSTTVAASTNSIGCRYGNLIAEANKGNTPSSVFVYALLHVVRHSSLSIKHAKLTSQMEALDIQYVEETGLRDAFSDIWFRLPFAQNDSWQHICLQLGTPGSRCWDVKINDQHFRDLWELQKGSKTTPWGSGVHIANCLMLIPISVMTGRMFSFGMRKLFGIKPDEKQKSLVLVPLLKDLMEGKSVAFWLVLLSSGNQVKMDAPCMSLLTNTGHILSFGGFLKWSRGRISLDSIRLTAGPLTALAAATRPARENTATGVPVIPATATSRQSNQIQQTQGTIVPSTLTAPNVVGGHSASAASEPLGGSFHGVAGRSGPGIVPSSLLPIDVSVVLRGPYWIRIIYRKRFAVDMRCFAGDQVWLQPATPPKGGASIGGSLPCPQFRPFIMEHVAQELNGLEPNLNSADPTGSGGNIANFSSSSAMSRAVMSRVGGVASGLSVRRQPGSGSVPLVAFKKVLHGILKYLGVLWLFAQLRYLLREILGSILKENEGALLNLDQEQPALHFFVGGYVFAVSVHRVQLLLQVLSVRRFHHQQQQQQQQNGSSDDLTQSEIGEICKYFSRRVASEPYDASRVASFITLLTLPIPVLREFLKLIAWKKDYRNHNSKNRACLENHSGTDCAAKSNIHYDRTQNTVDFSLTVVIDPAHIPHVNAAGGAAWLPYCVSVRLRYTFEDNPSVTFLGTEGSHGGRACWQCVDDWEKCKQRVSHTVEVNGSAAGDLTQGN
ncbi:hypothetical protein Bca52824_019299 [Brassica carinata]|uniref:Mediator of RNA polymerase II transcription subunit 14 n=1 Tax=Brassica carinata TaxID=52824 RepID=A0A8X8AZF1_BRACI|nr:hypothetical protein Bca52824_019299 [Brassica carinata]